MTKKEQKLKNRIFELNSMYGQQIVYDTETIYCRFYGPFYRKIYFLKVKHIAQGEIERAYNEIQEDKIDRAA